ncbi:MAG: hypothetical protein RQ847_03635, partial [Wenzhouxiangellaceae bacterium]|nr:hypothetical protein [Wenzhouxiangellaceae bacterium]
PGAVLRERVLERIGRLDWPAGVAPDRELPWPTSGQAVSGLPGVRGWLSGYTGPVTPSAETWQENDGSKRGRYVLANGTVICTRRRAPAMDELMHPWKSLIVTMGSICGRESPDTPDFSDPRIQPPPARAVRAGGG